jgi:photosystem II stability/assembly factor-like uncharacterized protein
LPLPSPAVGLEALNGTTAYGAQDASDQGAVLGTTNGGRRWQVLASLPVDLESVDFVAGGVGFAVGTTWDLAANLPRWRLYATDRSGRSWTLRTRLGLRGDQQVSGLWMADSSRGLVLITSGYIYPQINEGGVAPAFLMQTSDGGRTWGRVGQLPMGSTDTFDGATFARAGGNRWDGWFFTSSGIERTTDTGQHWQPLRRMPPVSGIDLITPSFGVGWSFGLRQSSLWSTLDGGEHWTRAALPARVGIAQPSFPAQVSFASPPVGWLAFDGTTWRTSDGGRSWHIAGRAPLP